MKRGGYPEEVARAVLWLLSEEASYTTGAYEMRHKAAHLKDLSRGRTRKADFKSRRYRRWIVFLLLNVLS